MPPPTTTSSLPLPDSSFHSEQTDARPLLQVERAFAAHAVASARRSKLYQAPATGMDALSGYFPNGSVNARDGGYFKSSLGPATAQQLGPLFPPNVTGPTTVIETSEPIVLTKAGVPTSLSGRVVPVESDAHLLVFGDIVTIQGRISLPGKHVVIVAREVRSQAVKVAGSATEQEAAELNVDGLPPPPPQLARPQAATGAAGEAAMLRPTDHVFMTYDSRWARPGEPGVAGADGSDGLPGQPAGSIFIFCREISPFIALKLSACGGAGQDGQPGQPGGAGGPGGDGVGMVIGKVGRNQGVYIAQGREGGFGGWGGHGGAGGRGGDAGNCIVVLDRALPPQFKSSGLVPVARPGGSGVRGADAPTGPDGPQGRQLSTERRRTGPPKVVSPPVPPVPRPQPPARKPSPDPAPALWGRRLTTFDNDCASTAAMSDHPAAALAGLAPMSYLQKSMESARTRYLQWDALRFAQDETAGGAKQELLARLEHLLAALRLAPASMSDAEQAVVDGMLNSVAGLVDRCAKGLDYFGNTSDDVPLGSPRFFLHSFKESLALLERRGALLRVYQDALGAKKSVDEQTFQDLQDIDHESATLVEQQGQLRKVMTKILRDDLPQADAAVVVARRELQPPLEALGDWVEHCFGLTPKDFLDCVFNMAFIGSPFEANPRPGGASTVLSKHGLFTASTTITSQVGNLITKAVDTLPNDEDQPVNRQRLLRRVDQFTGSLRSLKEAYAMIRQVRYPEGPEAIRLDDPDAYRLLVQQQDFEELLDQFSNRSEAAAAVKAMRHYVTAVQQRNAIVADYNGLVSDYLRAAGDRLTLHGRSAAAARERSANAQPNLYFETAYAAALYDRTRENCIAHAYLASRAHRFWTLQPETALFRALHLGKPYDMNHTVLSAAAEELCETRDAEIAKAFGSMVQYFPDQQNEYEGSGRYVRLTPESHPEVFAGLRAGGSAVFSLEGLLKRPMGENPFHGCFNVRLRRVRVWIEGLKAQDSEPTQNQVWIDIRHLGRDSILALDGEVHTFQHRPVSTSMAYTWSVLAWDAGQRVTNPRDALKHEGHDGTLTIPKEYEGSGYPPLIGPFARWEISVKNNAHVDFSGISAVHLDFHGFFQNP